MIENFATLSVEEQTKFAKELLDNINSNDTFSNDIGFEFLNVEAHDLTGGLSIGVTYGDDPLEVPREATWTCPDDEDELYSNPDDPDYLRDLFKDIEDVFKTTEAVIDGYKVSLQVYDYDELETIDVEVDSYSNEDAGIGWHEFWGVRSYDSRPYIEVEGTIIKAYDCALGFFVEPIDAINQPSEETK